MKRAPSYKNQPSSMNPAAEEVWRYVVKHYADDIYESKSMRDQWKKAKSHFERMSAQRGVTPYVQSASLLSIAARLERLARRL